MVLVLKKTYFGWPKFLLFIFLRGLLTTVVVAGRTLKDSPEECFTALEIDDDTRAFENHNVPTSKADDLDLKKSWYRIMGKSANSLKQGFDRVVGSRENVPNFCGTVYAGTLMGEHPTVEEGMVEMTVCFRKRFCFYSNIDACECKSKKVIYVRNCQNNHFIYWLSPTNRQERYCTGQTNLNGVSITGGTSSNAVECRQHKVYDSPSRLWNKVSDVTCDIDSGWYRFTSDAGGEMASECQVNTDPISRLAQPCGAAFRGWMVDRHPSLAEGRRNARVCFSYPDSCSCEFYANIAVRNCGSFFVYLINGPPLCNGRYCGAPKGSSAAVSDATKPAVAPKKTICNMYDVLHDPSRLWSFTSPTETNCDARLYGYFRFGDKYTPWSIKEKCTKSDMKTVTHRCGTRYQGFMEFRHPTVNEGFVERIICFQDATVPCECQFNTIIGVQNCSGFYVYELRGVPKCEARMCMVANGSDTVRIDPDRPPIYGIPVPGYTIPEAEKSTAPASNGEEGVVTTTILCIIILIVLILIVIVILTVLYIAHPVIWPLRNKDAESRGEPENNKLGNSVVQQTLLVESCLSHDNNTSNEVGIPMDNEYTSIPNAAPEDQESDIIKRSDLVPDSPPEERRNHVHQRSPDEDDIQKMPDSDDETDEAEKSAESNELNRIEDDIDDIMHDLDVTRSDIANLLSCDTSV